MKIISMKSLGIRRTFSPEMKSSQHNYITAHSGAVHKNSHSVAYCLVAYKCLWLKSYFPHEWWASVMSYCDPKQLVRYMNVARGEGVMFVPVDVNNLSYNFVAIPEQPRLTHEDEPNGYVQPGLVCLKGIGKKVASIFTDDKSLVLQEAMMTLDEADQDSQAVEDYCAEDRVAGTQELLEEANARAEQAENVVADAIAAPVKTGPIESIDDFVSRKGKNKLLMERLIKLGSFRGLPGHGNLQAAWVYYLCKYGSGPEASQKKKEISASLLAFDGWDEQKIAIERQRQINEYKRIYPKRNKIPPKITNWTPKAELTLENINRLFDGDYGLTDILKFEETYLGYHLHSPLDLFVTKGGRTIEDAKENNELEAVITEVFHATTKSGSPMCRLTVTDGIQTALLILWSNDLEGIDKAVLRRGVGFRTYVSWNDRRRNFTLGTGGRILRLKRKEQDSAT